MTKRRFRTAAFVALGLVLAISISVSIWRSGQNRVGDEKRDGRGAESSDAPADPAQDRDALQRLDTAREELRTSSTGNPETSSGVLGELRTFLESLPPEQAARVIVGFLDGNADASTALAFKIGRDHLLESSPTLRVFLLDLLVTFDAQAAAAYAKTILADSKSADEWAVSLRNYAMVDDSADGKRFLESKVRELVQNPDWRAAPSVGFFEAFDVFVHTRSTESTPLLMELVRNKQRRDLAHASFLTLDRLTVAEPAGMLGELEKDPDSYRGRELMVSNFFARADVRNEAQRGLLERYLLDPRRTDSELSSWAGVYPNANLMISNNLLTSAPTQTRDELTRHDRAALQIISGWLEDGKFAPVKKHLEQARGRLAEFVEQARGGR